MVLVVGVGQDCEEKEKIKGIAQGKFLENKIDH